MYVTCSHQIFSHERKWYNRKDLARHRTHGDPDDTSHRGHPLCKFCDDRYLDNDELLKHLRRDHYFCHFCDADGAQEYYSDYQYLSEHFREAHYLCEEGRCATEQFTHAFRSQIDYKAHKASAHSKNRAEARQNRHIDLQFSYAPRQTRRNDGMVSGEDYEEARSGRGGRGRSQGNQQNTRGSWRYNRPPVQDDFPSLSAAMVTTPMTPAYSAQPRKHSSFQEEDFPALVSKIRPPRPAGGATSAWSQTSSSSSNNTSKTVILPSSSSRPPPNNPPLPLPAGPQLLSSSSSSRRKKLPARRPSPPSDDDNCVAKTMQEHRAVPTMLDISSLLTVKGPSKPPPLTAKPLPLTSKPSPVTSNPTPIPTPSPTSKTAKKKKQATPPPSSFGNQVPVLMETVSRVQKENVPESHASKPLVAMTTAAVKTAVKATVKASGLANGHLDKPVTVAPLPKAKPEPPLEVEEEFPALISKKPPPGT
uniref:Zinc finger protein 598 n=1 Tax=Hucho hucho TaxID=62062 RepID=A0A4W5KE41_9TELE